MSLNIFICVSREYTVSLNFLIIGLIIKNGEHKPVYLKKTEYLLTLLVDIDLHNNYEDVTDG